MKPPKILVGILATNLILGVVGAVTSGAYVSLAPLAVWAFFAWKALRGSQASVFLIGGIFGLGAIAQIYPLFASGRADSSQFISSAIGAALLIAIAGYIFFSPTVKAFYKESAKNEYGRR